MQRWRPYIPPLTTWLMPRLFSRIPENQIAFLQASNIYSIQMANLSLSGTTVAHYLFERFWSLSTMSAEKIVPMLTISQSTDD